MRSVAILVSFLFAHVLSASEFPVPLLELNSEGKWLYDSEPAGDTARLLKKFAAHTDAALGWAGSDAKGHSDNLLVIHATGLAPQSEVNALLAQARDAGIKRVAVASVEEVTTFPHKTNAPVAENLDSAYLLIDTLPDNGEQAPVANERLTLYCNYDATEKAGSYVLALDARRRTPVKASTEKTVNMVYAEGESAAVRKPKADNRARIQKTLVATVEDYIATTETSIEVLAIGVGADVHQPWLFVDIAARACGQVNAGRKSKLDLRWPFMGDAVAENPNPEQDLDEPNGGEVGPDGQGMRGGFEHRRVRDDGGSSAYNERVEAALAWLKDHQNREGYWSGAGFSEDTTRVDAKKTRNLEFVKPGEVKGENGWADTCDVGLTGLALLAFAGAGYDHKAGDYRATCRMALLYLRKIQDNDGCFGVRDDDHFVYNHAICTMAVAEIYGLSGDAVLKPNVDRAVEFILKAQNPGLGWRYGVQPGINDSSITGWMVLALKSAKLAGLEFDTTKSYADASEWFKLITVDVNGYPKVGYDSPGSNNARLRSSQEYEHNPTMDAVYITSMLSMGKVDLQDRTLKALARGCTEKEFLPTWDHHKIDFYYWYYASLALYQVGGTSWATWEKAMSKTMLDHQRGWSVSDKQSKLTTSETLDEHGSWDPVGAWCSAGGRVYSTAMGALILRTQNRYLRIEEE